MKLTFLFMSLIFLGGCSTASSSGKSKASALTGDTTSSSEELRSALKRGDNSLTGGYEVTATLLTESLIRKEEMEKAHKNMDTKETMDRNIQKELSLIDTNTCFSINVSSYSLENSSFKNWVAKLKTSSGEIIDVTLRNVRGVESVPEPFKDMQGRTWHNNTIACSSKVPQIEKGFSLYLIPQFANNNSDGKSELSWTFE